MSGAATLARFVAPALLLLPVACTRDEGPPIETADLAADVRLSVPIELVDDIRYVAGSGEEAIVVSRRWPYVRALGEAGAERAGRAAARMPQPWGGFARGDSLWIFEAETWALWSLGTLEQLDRGSLPARTVAAAHGCGDRLVAVFAGGSGPAAELVGDFGLRAFDSGAWWTLSSLAAGDDPAVYAGAGSGAVAVLPSGEVALFNGARGQIDLLPCGPYGRRYVEVADLARERLPVRARGMAEIDGVLVWFWSPAVEDEAETRVGYWMPGRGVRGGRRVTGDVRLFGGAGRVWLLDVSAAELLAVDGPAFLKLLGVPPR